MYRFFQFGQSCFKIYILHVQEHGKTTLVLHQDTSGINASIYYRCTLVNKPFCEKQVPQCRERGTENIFSQHGHAVRTSSAVAVDLSSFLKNHRIRFHIHVR